MGFGKRLMRTALTGAALTIGAKVASEVISNHVVDKVDATQRRILEQVGRNVQMTAEDAARRAFRGAVGEFTFAGNNPYDSEQMAGQTVKKATKNPLAVYENKLLLAKLAICVYISRADGNVNDAERAEIKTMVEQILQHDTSKILHNEARKICNHEGSSFVFFENYLLGINEDDLSSFIAIIEEMGNVDGALSEMEAKAIKRVRQYVSDRTGKDFRVKEEVNLSCEGCGAILHVNSDETMAHCPYCGATKLI